MNQYKYVIEFAMYLTGHTKETIIEKLNEWLKFKRRHA